MSLDGVRNQVLGAGGQLIEKFGQRVVVRCDLLPVSHCSMDAITL